MDPANKIYIGAIAAFSMFNIPSSLQAEKPKHNIIFILVDDLGKEWINCYGAEGVKTPNIDKLAATGMKFNNAYSMPQCTPSRVCFMTGQYPYHNGWVNHWDVPRWGVGYFDWKRNPSIGRTMQRAGHKTGVAGKWQLNDFRIQPDAMLKHGFDDYCMWTGYEAGNPASKNRYWDPYIHTREGSKTYKGKFGPDIYSRFVLDFIKKNRDNPFFLYYPMTLTHAPFVNTPHDMNVTDKLERFKAMIRYTDFLLGKVVKQVDDLGIRKNTIIIWTTDNGTSKSFSNILNGRVVKGGKTLTTENGVNAPFIVNCPGIVPEGTTSDALLDFTDMLPTFANFAGVSPEPEYKYDGVSLKDVFLGKSKNSKRKWILAMGSKAGKASDKGIENVYYFRDRVIREARYKLFVGIDRKPEKLVDVIKDPEEKNNLIGNPEYKEILVRLTAVIDTLPKKDNDPNYEHLPKNPWDKRAKVKSQKHKIGYPN
jgi:arylsulfatase A-like enzyme